MLRGKGLLHNLLRQNLQKHVRAIRTRAFIFFLTCTRSNRNSSTQVKVKGKQQGVNNERRIWAKSIFLGDATTKKNQNTVTKESIERKETEECKMYNIYETFNEELCCSFINVYLIVERQRFCRYRTYSGISRSISEFLCL